MMDAPTRFGGLSVRLGDRTYVFVFFGEGLGIQAQMLGSGFHACAEYSYGDLGSLPGLGYLGF
jgi:hypothetical protein